MICNTIIVQYSHIQSRVGGLYQASILDKLDPCYAAARLFATPQSLDAYLRLEVQNFDGVKFSLGDTWRLV